jgi:NAD(P)-dependent dehydrogenase (short-subunit alcohol dehydrogenase family)
VAPGYVATQMVEELVLSGRVNAEAIAARTPMRRMAQPEEVAAAVVFLTSDAAGYITGETLMVDGGWSSWAAI